MDDAIIKEIILKIADQYILDKSDKEFLGREHTIYSYYINSNKHIENTVINIINCLKWRRCSLPKYILKYCSNNCEYALKLKNGAIPIIYLNSYHGESDIRYLIYNCTSIIENILKTKSAKTYDLIIDVHKIKTSHYTDISGIINLIDILKKYYPQQINKVYIINVNIIIYKVLDVVIPYCSEYMNGRIFPIKDTNDLQKLYNPNIIDYLNNIKNDLTETPKNLALRYNLL